MTHSNDQDAITITGLTAHLGGRRVLHDISTRLPLGGVTAIVGANGSGKSTLLGTLAGVVTPSSGTIYRPWRGHPAYVVQRSAVADLLPVTVRDTVAMGRWATANRWLPLSAKDKRIIRECLEKLGIGALADRRLSALSGGQRQRALVAQGLAQDAAVLLLDEPAAGLDEAAKRDIADVIDEASANGVTVVQATHDVDDALRADHCLRLEAGRLAADGAPRAVLR
ncbi:zinc ABC transporter ATP-binding protein AztA [Saccharomonospora sp. NPDC006951]